MNRRMRHSIVLAACAMLAASALSAQTVTSHETDIAFDGVSAQFDAFDTFSSPAPVAFTPQVQILGDPSTFTWDGSGKLTVANVSTTGTIGAADLALTGTGNALNPLIGYSHYGYGSSVGQGLFTTTNVGGNLRLSLANFPGDLGSYSTPYTVNLAFLGQWSTDGTGPLQINTSSFQVTPNFTVTKNFEYDPTFDLTLFSATAAARGPAAFTPEPGAFALFVGMSLPASLLVLRRRRRA